MFRLRKIAVAPIVIMVICTVHSLAAQTTPTYSWADETPANGGFPNQWPQAVVYDDGTGQKLWVLGGTSGAGATNEIWTFDGSIWTDATPTGGPPWPERHAHAVTVFDDGTGEKIWLMGGRDGGTYYNDVWSFDGTTWTDETPTSGTHWSGRFSLAVAAYDDGTGEKLWVLGGWASGYTVYDDVWSFDGTAWTNETPTGGHWAGRQGHSVVVYDDGAGEKLWLVGGSDGPPGFFSTSFDDVWSFDGTAWTDETPTGGHWAPRSNADAVVYDNGSGARIWLMGGGDDANADGLNDIWTFDGNSWVDETPSTPHWSGRGWFTAAVFDDGIAGDRIWVLGGTTDQSVHNPVADNVWSYGKNPVPAQFISIPVTDAVENVQYTYTLAADGVPSPAFSIVSAPAWLSLNGDTLEGMPGSADIGIHSVTVRAENSTGQDDQTFDVDVVQQTPPVITSSPVTSAVEGSTYTYVITASGAPAPTFSAGTLPSWLTLSGDTLSGVPGILDVGNTDPITITATNTSGTDDQTFQIDVEGPPAITSAPVTDASAGTSYSYTVTASGNPAPTFSAGTLPPWLTLDAGTGELHGTPDGEGTTELIEITAANTHGSDMQSFTIDVARRVGDGGDDDDGGCVVSARGTPPLALMLGALGLLVLILRLRRRPVRVPRPVVHGALVLLSLALAAGGLHAQTTGGPWTWENAHGAETVPLGGWHNRNDHASVSFDGKMWVFGGYANPSSLSGGISGYKNDVWCSTDGVTWTEATPPGGAPWGGRVRFTVTVFDPNGNGNRLWVIGGQGLLPQGGVGRLNDVWSSADGVTWQEETPVAGAPWPARSGHAAVAYDDRLWVMGGMDINTQMLNDVWSSTDGVTWVDETPSSASPMWHARHEHAAVVYDDGSGESIWVLGGSEFSIGAPGYSPELNDVWRFDGTNWTNVTPASGTHWSPRQEHAAAVYDGKIWITGGSNLLGSGVYQPGSVAFPTSNLNDVWSFDGTSWTDETPTSGDFWLARESHTSIAHDDGTGEKLWMIGGDSVFLGHRNDVWSYDGTAWDEVTPPPLLPLWSPRYRHTSATYDDGTGEKLYVIGGAGEASNDVWCFDGTQWTELPPAPWPPRQFHATVVFDDGSGEKIWVMGGREGPVGSYSGPLLNDIWTFDGTTWTNETPGSSHPSNNHWSPRLNHAAAVYNDGSGEQIWVVGGEVVMPGYANNPGGAIPVVKSNEVWSFDGTTWTNRTPSTGSHWAPRGNHAAVVFDDGGGEKLWVLGGKVKPSASNNYTSINEEVWCFDGVGWTDQTPASGLFPGPRFDHAVAVFDDGTGERLWVLGGYVGYNGLAANDVWSFDGANWSSIVPPPGHAFWSARGGQTAEVFDDGSGSKIWLLGGRQGFTGFNDIWTYDPPDVAPQITSSPNTAAEVGVLYNYDVQTTGRPKPTLSIVGGPSWLTFNGTVLEGTPTAADVGSHPVTIRAENGLGQDEQSFTLRAAIAPQITSVPPAAATEGSLYSYTIAATGTPSPAFSIVSAPAWLTLNGDTLEGTPGPGDIGMTAPITIEAANAAGTDSQTFQIDVQGPPQITSSPVLSVTVGEPYTYTVTATGNPDPVLSAGVLPGWLSFDTMTGELTGTPTSEGETETITIAASNGQSPSAVQSFVITVSGLESSTGGGNGGDGGNGCAARGRTPVLPVVFLLVVGLAVALRLRPRRRLFRAS